MQNFLTAPPAAIADALEQRLGPLSDADVKHILINVCNRLSEIERQVGDLSNREFRE